MAWPIRRKSFDKPITNCKLAECFGILMGDGGISSHQVVVSLHHIDDAEYSVFVSNLLYSLFGVRPAIYHRQDRSLNNVTISRIALVEYLHSLGLPIRNKIKSGLDMPSWIKGNQNYRLACLRGLVDTDGSIFTHRYRSKEKWYEYKKLSFTSASQPLLVSVYESLVLFGMKPRFGSNNDVRLDSQADMKRYFSTVGTNNPKHLRRYGF